MKNNLEKFVNEEILKDPTKYFELLSKHKEWILNLEEKYKLDEFLYKNHPNKYKICFREFHNIIRRIAIEAYNKNYFQDSEISSSIYDIYLEYDQRRGYYYNLKFYHFNESYMDIIEKIQRLISRDMRISPIKGNIDSQETFPKWKTIDYSLSAKNNWIFNFDINYYENDPKIPHNHLFIATYFIEDKTHKNFWEAGPSDLINSFSKIIEEISHFDTLELIIDYNLPDNIHEIIIESSKMPFSYIKDEKIKSELEKRLADIRTLKSHGFYLYCMILMGSIIEQLLRSYYDLPDSAGTLINKAKGEDKISDSDKFQLLYIYSIRNYIHINLYIDSKDEITEKKFNTAFQVFKEVLEKLKKLF